MTCKNVIRSVVLTAVAATVGSTVVAVRAQDPPQTITEKLKAKAGSAVTSLKKGAVSAEEAIMDRFRKAKDGVVNMGIEARVYSRLHWDKGLTDAKIELTAPEKGAIVLKGTVPDEKAKAKAAELAADTVGVVKVTNELTVLTTSVGGTAASPSPAKP